MNRLQTIFNETLMESIENVSMLVTSTASTIHDCAGSVNEATENTSALVDSINSITDAIEINSKVSEDLTEEIDKFKYI